MITSNSKYIFNEKINSTDVEHQMKRLNFNDMSIRKIKFFKKKFQRELQTDIKELTQMNPNNPAGFKNPKGADFQILRDVHQVSETNDIFKQKMELVLF